MKEKPLTARVLFPCGTVFVNKDVSEMTDILKVKLRELLEDITLLRVWVSLLIPRVEDGNNFGVEAQEFVLDEILTVEDFVKMRRQTITNYYIDRGDLITKIIDIHSIQRTTEERCSKWTKKCFMKSFITKIEIEVNEYRAKEKQITENSKQIDLKERDD